MSLLRNPLMHLTKSIWQAFTNNRWERANYLKALYNKAGSESQTTGWYLDIGARDGINSLALGQDFARIVMLDIQLGQEARAFCENHSRAHCVLGNAQSLPFRDCSFGLVTMISTLEHVKNPEEAVYEASRAIKTGGHLVIQVPNSYFPLDLHTGLPNPFLFCPGFLRRPILTKLGYSWWVDDVHKAPSERQVATWVKEYMQLVGKEKVIYPDVLIPKALRPLYGFFRKARLLNLMPLGYMYIYQKV